LKLITQNKILSVTYDFSLLQLTFTAKVKEKGVKNELLEKNCYAADKFKPLPGSFRMGKPEQKSKQSAIFMHLLILSIYNALRTVFQFMFLH